MGDPKHGGHSHVLRGCTFASERLMDQRLPRSRDIAIPVRPLPRQGCPASLLAPFSWPLCHACWLHPVALPPRHRELQPWLIPGLLLLSSCRNKTQRLGNTNQGHLDFILSLSPGSSRRHRVASIALLCALALFLPDCLLPSSCRL